MRNIKIILEYDGSNYHGWQRQTNGVSIQQILEEKIAVMTKEKIKVIGSGRTDAGVHALGQVAHFKTASSIREVNLLKGINSLLPKDIVVRDLREVDASFHARYDVKSKVYLYQIVNSSVRRFYTANMHGLSLRRSAWNECGRRPFPSREPMIFHPFVPPIVTFRIISERLWIFALNPVSAV